jgi:hypothetical protein
MSDFYSSRPVKARKPHRCWMCHEPIEPGAIYVREAGVSDGDFWQNDYHAACMWLFAAVNYVWNETPEDGWDPPEEVWYDLDAEDRAKILAWPGADRPGTRLHDWPRGQHSSALPASERARLDARVAKLDADVAESKARRAWELGESEVNPDAASESP